MRSPAGRDQTNLSGPALIINFLLDRNDDDDDGDDNEDYDDTMMMMMIMRSNEAVSRRP